MQHRLSMDGINLHLVYGTPTTQEVMRHDEGYISWGVKVPCHYFSFGGRYLVLQNIPKNLYKNQDLIILPQENGYLFNYRLLFQNQNNSRRIAFWGHGKNFQEKSNKLLQSFRSKIVCRANWWFAYTILSVQRIREAGFSSERITCLNNTVDVAQLSRWREIITPNEQADPLKKLRLQGIHLAIFLGGLIPAKRLDFLFKTSDLLKTRFPDFELLIIGDGPLREKVQNFTAGRPWGHWVGAKYGREKVLYLSLGQLMLNPGMVGLVILDSFVCGLPMVTTDCKIHSPEIAYLDPGRNGIITENTLEAFTEEVGKLFVNPSLRQKIAEEDMKDSSRYFLDSMVKRFCEGITQALNTPRFFAQ
jgi:glycosyltransferase involved in cell wall biosynthesis